MALQYNLMNQDVFEGLKTLESDSFDLCIVDSPYGASSKHNWDYGKKEMTIPICATFLGALLDWLIS